MSSAMTGTIQVSVNYYHEKNKSPMQEQQCGSPEHKSLDGYVKIVKKVFFDIQNERLKENTYKI